MTLTIDFSADWKTYMLADIASQGYQVDPSEPLESISYKFFNVRQRRLQARPRNVHESSEFQCPAKHSNGYQALKAKLAAGDDVNPHLSRSLLNVDYNDPLLNDWGIHHFHLGQTVEASGFIDRTGPLLFSFITPDDAYCINVFPHGVWSEQELIKIIHRNWPDVISDFKLNGVLGLAHSVSNQDIAKFRKAGVQTMVEVGPSVVYAPVGGGYSMAGTSLRATMESQMYRRLVRSLESHVRENLQIFLDKIAEHGLSPASPPTFSLLVNDDGFLALETGSKVAFMLHPHNRG
jgi:hypothetical protein